MPRSRLVIFAALLAVAGLAAAAALRSDRLMAVETKNAFTVTRDLPGPLVGKPAPSGRFTLADGTVLELAELKGKTVLISFWSSF